jgi:hypothetical protein
MARDPCRFSVPTASGADGAANAILPTAMDRSARTVAKLTIAASLIGPNAVA